MRKNFKLLGAVAVAGVVATTGSAFTNSNTGDGTLTQVGGYNAASVTGVAVSNVVYDYSPDRATLDTVTYTVASLDPTATAEVSHNGGTTWKSCAPRTLAADPIICTIAELTTAVTTMNLVVRASDSTTTA